MLTRKKGYFQYQDEREDFAVYLATTVYNRYRSNEEQPKSVLNYIKSVIGYKKIDYTKEQWQQNITPEIIGDNKYNYELEDKLIQPSVSLLKVEFREYINQLFSVIRKEV